MRYVYRDAHVHLYVYVCMYALLHEETEENMHRAGNKGYQEQNPYDKYHRTTNNKDESEARTKQSRGVSINDHSASKARTTSALYLLMPTLYRLVIHLEQTPEATLRHDVESRAQERSVGMYIACMLSTTHPAKDRPACSRPRYYMRS